jgi:hypothetical protein
MNLLTDNRTYVLGISAVVFVGVAYLLAWWDQRR